MAFFCDTHHDPEDELFPIQKRLYPYYKDTSGRSGYAHRFLSYSYTRDLISLLSGVKGNVSTSEQIYCDCKNQEIIYRNIGARSGRLSLQNTMRYLSRTRELDKRNDKSPITLFDSNHQAIDSKNIDAFISTFSNDFKTENYKSEHSYFYNLMAEKGKNKQKMSDIELDIWRIGTRVKFRDNWAQEAIVTEVCGFRYVRIEHPTKDGLLSDYIDRDSREIIPTVTPEGLNIFNHKKANNPEEMIVAHDDSRYSVHKNRLHRLEKDIPTDFHHLTFSLGNADYDINIAHSAFRDFLESSLKDRGFDYIYCFHNDTNNPHYHVICKTFSRENNKHFPVGKKDSFILRRELNNHLYKNGIDRVATRRIDRVYDLPHETSIKDSLNDDKRLQNIQKSDVFNYIDNVFECYHLIHGLENNPFTPQCSALETKLRQSINQSEKKDLKRIVESGIKESKAIDQHLHEIMVQYYKDSGKQRSKGQLKKDRARLFENLTKAKEDIEEHPHPLSPQQEQTKQNIDILIKEAQKLTKEKSKTSKQQNNDLKL